MILALESIALGLSHFELRADLELRHDVTALVGPSGAGKTSLLDVIAGLRRPSSGRITFDEQVVFDAALRIDLPSRFRGIGYVPQDESLFPHLSVAGNVRYGSGRSRDGDDAQTIEHIIDVLEIRPLLARATRTLSGGERRRVALARALASSPGILLLDEPLSALDRELKARILTYLQRVRDEFRLPMIYVSHDLSEVATIADEVIMIERGVVVAR